MMAVLSRDSRAGIKERMDMVSTQARIMEAAMISLREIGPSSALSLTALSFRPGMTFFSGLKKIKKNTQSRKTISQPMGNM